MNESSLSRSDLKRLAKERENNPPIRNKPLKISSTNGKGSSPRPVDIQTYNRNFDSIFRKKYQDHDIEYAIGNE